MSNYKIDKNISIPPHIRTKEKYPFSKLKVGDSFYVKIGEKTNKKRSILGAMASANTRYKKRRIKFSSRMSEDGLGLRIWRIK